MKKPSNPPIQQRLAVIIACSFFCVSAQAAALYQTSGLQDPATQGGESHFSAGPPIVTTSSGNDGENYWRLHTGPFPGDSGSGYYHFHMLAANTADPTGWTLTYRAKVNLSDRDGESYMAVVDGVGRGWLLDLIGGPGIANPHVGMLKATDPFTSWTVISNLDPSLAYHTYQMVYDATSASTGFYADGSLLATMTSAESFFVGPADPRIEWGDLQGTGPAAGSESQWSLVSFEIGQHVAVTPEPSSIALACLAGCSLLAISFSRKRNRKNC